VPVVLSDVDTVSLLPALGWLPPLLKHWYTAVAVLTVSVSEMLVVPVPSPASLNEVVSAPVLLLMLLSANRKCGLSATAAAARAGRWRRHPDGWGHRSFGRVSS
jgi:hypothetical protein